MLIAMMAIMKLKEDTGLVVLKTLQLQQLASIIVCLIIARRQDKGTLNYLTQSMLSVIITELGELVGNAVQDTLYHMTPLTVSVYITVVLDGQC